MARVRLLPAVLNRFHPPGMKGAGLYDVLEFFWGGMSSSSFNLSAMAMAYRFFFALFPALILIFTLIPYIPVPDLKPKVMNFLASVVPEDSLGFVYRIVDEFFNKPSAGVIYLTIFLTLGSALSGIKVMMAAFTEETAAFKKRNFIKGNVVAVTIFFTLVLVFVVMVGVLSAGEYFSHFLEKRGIIQEGGFTAFLLVAFYWILLFVTAQVAVSVVYFMAPARYQRWNFFTPGSVLSGLLIVVAIVAFRLFFVNFTDYNKIYGSLGAIMLLMVWFYWISIVLLIGFELNVAIDKVIAKGQPVESNLTPPKNE